MLKKRNLCPHCHHELNKEIQRIIECPYCEQPIYYRYDELCTQDEARKMDWREQNLVIFALVKR